GLLAERGHQGELVDAELSDQHDDERLLLLLGQLSGLGNIRLGRQSGIDRDLCERLWQTIPSAPDKIRTCDLWLRRPTLYPAELRVRVACSTRPRPGKQASRMPHGDRLRARDELRAAAAIRNRAPRHPPPHADPRPICARTDARG